MSKSTIKIIAVVFVIALAAWFFLRPGSSSISKSKQDSAAEETATSVETPATSSIDPAQPSTSPSAQTPAGAAASSLQTNSGETAPPNQTPQPSGLKGLIDRETSPTTQEWKEKLNSVYKKLDPQTVSSLDALRSAHRQEFESRWMQIEMNKKTDPHMNENMIFAQEMIGIDRKYDAQVEELLGRVKFGDALKLREKFNEPLRARGDQPIGSQW